MASPNAGGFVEITINGKRYAPAGEIEVEETNFESEVQDNHDGTISRSQKPGHYKMKLTLRDRQGPSIVREIYLADRIDVSGVEKQMGRTVILTGAFAVGKPARNTRTGEITNIELVSDTLQYA